MQQPEFDDLPETFVRYAQNSGQKSGQMSGQVPSNHDPNRSGSGKISPPGMVDPSLPARLASDTLIELLAEAWRGEECPHLYAEFQQVQQNLELAQHQITSQDAQITVLQEQVNRLELDLQAKQQQLAHADAESEDLRNRLRRQHHHTSQLKAALEKRVESVGSKVAPSPASPSNSTLSNSKQEQAVEPENQAIAPTTNEPVAKNQEAAPMILVVPSDSNRTEIKPWARSTTQKLVAVSPEKTPVKPLATPMPSTVIEIVQTVSAAYDPLAQSIKLPELNLTYSTPIQSIHPALKVAQNLTKNLSESGNSKSVKTSTTAPTATVESSSDSSLSKSAVITGKSKVLTTFASIQLPKFQPLQR